jgi:hypothetical protein
MATAKQIQAYKRVCAEVGRVDSDEKIARLIDTALAAAEPGEAALETELLAVAEALDMVNRPEGQGGYERASGERMAAEVLRLKCIELQTVPALEAELAEKDRAAGFVVFQELAETKARLHALIEACTPSEEMREVFGINFFDNGSQQVVRNYYDAIQAAVIATAPAESAKPAVDGAVAGKAVPASHEGLVRVIREIGYTLAGHLENIGQAADAEIVEKALATLGKEGG